jgi:hypothetical protein
MRSLVQLGLAGLMVATLVPLATGAELANLRNGFSIRAERHEMLGDMTRLYTGPAPSSGYVDVPTAQIDNFEPAPPELQPTATQAPSGSFDLKSLVNSASERSQVDADFIASVIRAESGNNPKAVSRKGARGLMQLMPGTANQLGVTNSFDPAQNVEAGVRYLRELLLLYHNDMVKALAAYNAGPQRVDQYKGVPPYRETHAYVARVITDYNRKKLAHRKLAPATTEAHKQPPHVATTASADSGPDSVAHASRIARNASSSPASE